MASVYFSVCHSGHNFVCAGITKLAVKTKADLQKRGSMEPMEPPLDPPLVCVCVCACVCACVCMCVYKKKPRGGRDIAGPTTASSLGVRN